MKKVTFIYAHEEGEIWSTPMALISEFQNREWQVNIISIGSNRTGQYSDTKLKEWILSKPETDIVLFMDFGRFDSVWLDKQYLPNVYWIQESGDDPQNYKANYTKAHKFHLTFTPDLQASYAYKLAGVNCIWINHFADTRVQYPKPIKAKYVAVTTRGRGGSDFLDRLTEWSDGSIGNLNGLNTVEHTDFLNSGLMVIQNSRWGEITRRIFEGMACGKLVITDRLDPNTKLQELFIENVEIVFYNNLTDCINKINYYAENKQERERIASNGYNKVLDKYTQVQVVDELIQNYSSHSIDNMLNEFSKIKKPIF